MIIVTGGAGFIGSNIVKALNDKGITDILVVDNLKDGTKFVNLVDLNIADYMDKEDFLIQIMAGEEFGDVEAIFHEGACSSTTEWDGKYMMDNNYQYSKELLHYCLEREIPFLYASSAATYGVPPVDVVPEDVVPMLPINPYGQTKLFGEWMARACEEPYGIRFCGLRYFNVAGCGPVELEDPAILNLIPMLFDRLKKGKAPAIFGDDYPTPDGTCVRDYIHVSDLADAHIAALKYLDRDERKYDAFNVGTGEGTSVRQIVDEVKKVTGLPFEETVMARRAGDPPHLIGSPKRINEEMGWHAQYNVEDIVKSAWDAWQANPEHHIDVETWKQTD